MTGPAHHTTLDHSDPLADLRAEFTLPSETIYLDGNSLGALPKSVRSNVCRMIDDEWGQGLVRSWTTAGWFEMPLTLGDRLAPLLGAGPGQVVVCDSTSVNLFKVLTAALRLRPERSVLVVDRDNFPSDLYVGQAVAGLGDGLTSVQVGVDGPHLEEVLDDRVSAILMGHVDYRTGFLHDMAAVTELAHRHGALMIWDVCHSAGAMPLSLNECDADFAVGCTYKYLNGGPGSPAFIYAAPRFHQAAEPSIVGWFGHAAPLGFAPEYSPAPSMARFLLGTPPLLAYAALEASLDLWARVDLQAVRAKSVALTNLLIESVDERCDGRLKLITPRDPARRGSQVSYRHPNASSLVEALAEHGVIADSRRPDILRFGLAPLYLSYADVHHAVQALAEILTVPEA